MNSVQIFLAVLLGFNAAMVIVCFLLLLKNRAQLETLRRNTEPIVVNVSHRLPEPRHYPPMPGGFVMVNQAFQHAMRACSQGVNAGAVYEYEDALASARRFLDAAEGSLKWARDRTKSQDKGDAT